MKQIIVFILAAIGLISNADAATSASALESLLPAETVLLIAAPEYASAKKHFKASALGKFWDSAEFRPFRKKFADGFEANVLVRIEEELAVDFERFEEMANGPVALAVVLEQDISTQPSLLFLLDAGRKTFTLRRTLSQLERDWKKEGHEVSETEIGGVDFATVSDPDSDVKVHFGRVGAQLIIGTGANHIEGVLNRLNGKVDGALIGNTAFAMDRNVLLNEADIYMWADFGRFIPQLLDNVPFGAELGIDFSEVVGSLGFNELGTSAITYRDRPDGVHLNMFFGLPESKRKGLFNLLNTRLADASPPVFVPTDVVTYTRWRADLSDAWSNFEKLLLELSPDVANVVEFTVGLLGKDKDSKFDFKKKFLANFGDDLIFYQMPPKDLSLSSLGSGSMVALVKSPDPEGLIQGIGAIPGILPPPLNEAELKPRKLGKNTAYSFGLIELPDPSTGELVESEVLFSVKEGYLAISNDLDQLLALLDGKKQHALTKRERLAMAATVVGGTDSGFFSYQNDRVMIRSVVDTLSANADQLGMIFSMIPMEGLDEVSLNDWLDFSLLPEGEVIAKYFDFTVYGASNDERGFTLKMFSPRPQGLKR